jgi:hypothetical protein
MALRAFSSEVDTGSREENASKQEIELRSDSIGTEKPLAFKRTENPGAKAPGFLLAETKDHYCLG